MPLTCPTEQRVAGSLGEQQITAVAWFGGTVFASGAIVNVTVHIRR
ncbi:hypothetical protein [Streptomyces sp. PSKA30]|nr:hypothetical protein [Streptomyces sp. PSKA30]MBZ9637929.1 hypothetical protein [Streptomyces sp. PSKA30]